MFRYVEKSSKLQQIKHLGVSDLSNLQLRFLCPQDINEVTFIIHLFDTSIPTKFTKNMY